MAKIPTVPVELVVKIGGVEVYAGTVSMNAPLGTGDQPTAALEAMAKGQALKQLPTLTLKNLPQLRGVLNRVGEAHQAELRREQQQAEEAHRKAQGEAEE